MTTTRRKPQHPTAAAAILALLALCLCGAGEARAQWTTGNDIGNTNPGNVGVGTTSPPQTLSVAKPSSDTNPSDWAGAPPTLLLKNTSATNNNYAGIVFGNSAASTYFTSGIVGINETQTTSPSGRLMFFTKGTGAWAERMRITSDGRVGIGTGAPESALHVGNASGPGVVQVSGVGAGVMSFKDTGAQADRRLYQWRSEGGAFRMALINDTDGVYVRQNLLVADFTGNVGMGTAAPGIHGMSNTLTVQGATTRGMLELATGQADDNGLAAGQVGFFSTGNTGGKQIAAILGMTNGTTAANRGGDLQFFTKPDGGALAQTMTLTGGGSLGIGTAPGAGYRLDVGGSANVTGSVNVTQNITAAGTITGGSITATYQDVAEWVPSVQKLAAGTVVVLDGARTNHVLASSTAYDTKVAGVVSEQPGVILGVAGEGKVKVATTGRVRVKVDATRGAIKVGDLLVTSGGEGVAMKSVPVDFGGTQIHRPGTIIGKALEPLKKGTGEILVLLSLQ